LANFDDLSLVRQIIGKRGRPGSRQTVGAPSIFAGESLDETVALKSGKRLVKGPRLKFHTGKLGNVFHERVSMFLAARQTCENQCGDSGILPEDIQSGGCSCHGGDTTLITDTKQADVTAHRCREKLYGHS